MKNQTPTNPQTQRQKADSLKMEICLLLNWTEMQYCELQYQNGIAYLMWYLPCDEHAREKLLRSRLFWNWFKNQWTVHDESLLSYRMAVRECTVIALTELYVSLHCPRAMVMEVKPNDVVLSEIKTKEGINEH